MTIKTTSLTNHQYLVEGTDYAGKEGATVLNGTQYDEIVRAGKLKEAHKTFDSKVEDFFADLTAAADELEAAHDTEVDDELTTYVVREGVEAVEGVREERIELYPDTVILRAIATGKQDRLRWVNDTTLVVTAAPVETTPVEDENVIDSVPGADA